MSKRNDEQGRPQLPTSTAHQARLQLYQPTRRPMYAKRVIQTKWGTAVVDGRLGQQHADLLEAVMRCAQRQRFTDSGQLQLLVDPHELRRIVGGGERAAHDFVLRLFRELRAATIELRFTVGSEQRVVIGGIVDLVEASSFSVANPLAAAGAEAERRLWRVTIGTAFVRLLDGDLALNYDPAPIAALHHGVSQAVARWCATHRDEPNGGWLIDSLIEAVGASGSIRDRRRELIADAGGLSILGLELVGKRLQRS